jgi:hypothetical protein
MRGFIVPETEGEGVDDAEGEELFDDETEA